MCVFFSTNNNKNKKACALATVHVFLIADGDGLFLNAATCSPIYKWISVVSLLVKIIFWNTEVKV